MKTIQKEFDSYKKMMKYLSVVEDVHEHHIEWKNGIWVLDIVKLNKQPIHSEENINMNLLEKVGITLAGSAVAWFAIGMTWACITQNNVIAWSAIIPMTIFLFTVMIFEERLMGSTSNYSNSYSRGDSSNYSCSCDD